MTQPSTSKGIRLTWTEPRESWQLFTSVATLALSSQPRQRGCNVEGQEEARESHYTLPGMWESVREWTFTLPRQLPLWEMDSRWTPEDSERDFRGQNSMACGVLYINEKLLKLRCLKWARIAHLNIQNTSYGQKKGRESNWQFDSRPLKVGNRPLPDVRFEIATRRWKALNKDYNFDLDLVVIGLCSREIWASNVPGLQPGQFRDSNLEVPGKRAIWMQPLPRVAKYTIRGKVVASPKSGPWWILCVRVARGSS
jgi:hypothetical protein